MCSPRPLHTSVLVCHGATHERILHSFSRNAHSTRNARNTRTGRK